MNTDEPKTVLSVFICVHLWPVTALRAAEEAAVDRFRQNVSLDRLQHIRARLESVGGGLHVQLGIQRVEFDHVVVERTAGGCAGTAVHGAGGADLVASVGQ